MIGMIPTAEPTWTSEDEETLMALMRRRQEFEGLKRDRVKQAVNLFFDDNLTVDGIIDGLISQSGHVLIALEAYRPEWARDAK